MQYFHFLLSTGNNIGEAVTTLKQQIDTEYMDKACRIHQIFMLPELRPPAISTPNGQPHYVVNLLCMIVEEPEVEGLQRNYKPLFDLLNDKREDLLPVLQSWINMLIGSPGMPGA